jgi:hypothetical protein
MKLYVFASVFILLVSTLAYAVQRELLTRLPEPEPGPAPTTITVAEPSTLLRLDHSGLVVLRATHPRLGSYLVQALSALIKYLFGKKV